MGVSKKLRRALEPWITRNRRPSWRAVVSDLPGARNAGSQFGGAPALAPGEAWPHCPNCQQPLSLFVQLDLATLPDELPMRPKRGLLQLMYCTNGDNACDANNDGWQPFSTCHVVRIVDGERAPPRDRPATMFPQKTIVGWERFDDLPHPEDYGEDELPIDDEQAEEAEELLACAQGDKLG